MRRDEWLPSLTLPIIVHGYNVWSCASIEPRREKTGLRGFRPGPTQTGLYKLRKELEA